jgi:hypothetical protein
METCCKFPVPIRPAMFAVLDLQSIINPGRTARREIIGVPGARLHLER